MEHNPEDIILLCAHCHGLKTRGHIDNDIIAVARSPLDRPSHFKLVGTSPLFRVTWPSINLSANFQGIIVDNEPVFELRNQESELEPVVLSATLADRSGNELCRIVDNQFVIRPSHVGDLNVEKNRFTFTDTRGKQGLRFALSNRGLSIEQIFHVRRGIAVIGDDQRFLLGRGGQALDATGASITNSKIAISARSIDHADYANVDPKRIPLMASIRGFTVSQSMIGIALD